MQQRKRKEGRERYILFSQSLINCKISMSDLWVLSKPGVSTRTSRLAYFGCSNTLTASICFVHEASEDPERMFLPLFLKLAHRNGINRQVFPRLCFSDRESGRIIKFETVISNVVKQQHCDKAYLMGHCKLTP